MKKALFIFLIALFAVTAIIEIASRNNIIVLRNQKSLLEDMRHRISNLFKSKDAILLDLNFGMSEAEVEVRLNDLINKGDVWTEKMRYGNSNLYCHNIVIGGNKIKCKIYTNDDGIETGPLRSYSLDLTTLPFSETGNKIYDGDILHHKDTEVMLGEDFEILKNYLIENYGIPTTTTTEEDAPIFGGDKTIYTFETSTLDVIFTFSALISVDKKGQSYNKPICDFVSLTVKSKSYEVDFEKERKRREALLTPKDVISLYFDTPELEIERGRFDFDNTYKLLLYITNESYQSQSIIDEDILECKGEVLIQDAYGDVLAELKLVRKFDPPFENPLQQPSRSLPVYHNGDWYLGGYSWRITKHQYDEINTLIKVGGKVKAVFNPTGVVLSGGKVIK